jgi:hypothetical protein
VLPGCLDDRQATPGGAISAAEERSDQDRSGYQEADREKEEVGSVAPGRRRSSQQHPGWQWPAGSGDDAAPYFRIVSPAAG